MAKVIVTGGAGFIGSNVCNILSARGYSVTAFDNLSLGWRDNLNDEVQFVRGDTSNGVDLQNAGSADYIVHFAGSSSAPLFTGALRQSFHNSLDGFINVLEHATAIGAQKVVFASTSSVYGNTPTPHIEHGMVSPANYYAVSKMTMEGLARIYSLENRLHVVGLRFMSVYGLHEEHKGRLANLVSQFIWGLREGKQPLIYGDGRQTRDFVSVRDAVEAVELALHSKGHDGLDVFNVGTGRQTSVNELVNVLSRLMNLAVEPVYVPNPIEAGYIHAQQADISRAHEVLGFRARVSLEDGISELLNCRIVRRPKPASLSF